MKSYYLTGPDGSGKTTFLKEIEKRLNNRGKATEHIWLRSPKILSKPLMLYCRIVGLTTYNIIEGIKYGEHQFYRSSFVSWLFPIIQLADTKIKWLDIKRKIKRVDYILFDRFVIDTLADLMVDTHCFNLHKKWVGKQFIKMLNKETQIIVLKVDVDVIKLRKLDTKYDPNTSIKNKVYSILANDLNLKEVCNNRGINIVMEEIIDGFGLNERD